MAVEISKEGAAIRPATSTARSDPIGPAVAGASPPHPARRTEQPSPESLEQQHFAPHMEQPATRTASHGAPASVETRSEIQRARSMGGEFYCG